jgi:mono/diheme cytochrome c family protein
MRTAAHISRVALALGCTLALACSDAAEQARFTTRAPAAPQPSATSTPSLEPEPLAPPPDPAALAARGRAVYNANCIVCHNLDPAQDGGLGPAALGSSRELLEARVLRAEYPEGYTPKRDTRAMVPLPHLEPELDALTAFLARDPS